MKLDRTRPQPKLDDLPLFASDTEIGAAVLGPARAREWAQLAPLYEREGMPKLDQTFRGRYVPAVKRFLDSYFGRLDMAVDARPKIVEDLSVWKRPAPKRRA